MKIQGVLLRQKLYALTRSFKDIKIDILKMDTEGYEARIFERASTLLANNPNMIIMMEWSQEALRSQGSDPKAFLDNLVSHGFHKIWKIGGRRSREEGNFIAVSPEDVLTIPYCDLVLSRQVLNV